MIKSVTALATGFLMFASIQSQASCLPDGVTAPTAAEFSDTAARAKKLRYKGYDTTICKDQHNGILVGGVSSWNRPLQIFFFGEENQNVRTRRVSKPNETKSPKFKLDGYIVTLNFNTCNESQGDVIVLPSTLTRETGDPNISLPSMQLTCFVKTSELEGAGN